MENNKNNKEDYKEGIFILLITVVVFGGLMLWSKFVPFGPKNNWVEYEDFESSYYTLEEESDCCEKDHIINDVTVTVTKYNPTVKQCDSDPLITADGSFIDTLKLNNGELKWIAVSRDLRSDFHYGDTVMIVSDSGEIDGEYIVHDTMNPRWTLRIDILSPNGDSLGKWDNVCMYKK
jgi:3D (Asp-Asp-Asp) domain-containing protein